MFALIRRRDHFGIAHRAARLNGRRGTGFGCRLQSICKGEKGVAANHAALEANLASLAFHTANRLESTRLICPAPMPSVRSGPAYTIALDLTCLATRQPNSIACRSAAVGCRRVTILISSLRPFSVPILHQHRMAAHPAQFPARGPRPAIAAP